MHRKHTRVCTRTHTPRTDCSRNSAMASVLSLSMERANINSPSTSVKLSLSRARRRHKGCRTRDWTHTRRNTHHYTRQKTVSLQPFPAHSLKARNDKDEIPSQASSHTHAGAQWYGKRLSGALGAHANTHRRVHTRTHTHARHKTAESTQLQPPTDIQGDFSFICLRKWMKRRKTLLIINKLSKPAWDAHKKSIKRWTDAVFN